MRNWVWHTWRIAGKDLLLQLRDWRTFTVLLLMPLILIAILGTSIEGMLAGDDEIRLQLAVFDQSQSPLSRRLMDDLSADTRIEVEPVDTLREGEDLLYGGRRTALVVIGAQFENRSEELELFDILDPPNGRLARGLAAFDISLRVRSLFPLADFTISQVLLQRILNVVVPDLFDRLKLIQLYLEAVRESRKESPAIPSEPPEFRRTDARAGIYRTLVPSYAVFFAFFLLNMMAVSFIRERHLGTLTRLVVAPLSPGSLLSGKVLAFFVISVSQGILLFLAARFWFGIPLGPAPGVLLLVIVFTSLAATALGLCVATCFRSEGQVHSWASLLVIAMAAVSGCMVPRDWMSPFLQKLSFFVTPHSWALRAYDQLLYTENPEASQIGLSCLVLTGFALAFFAVGWWRFTRMERTDDAF